jgi:hypothetical protein
MAPRESVMVHSLPSKSVQELQKFKAMDHIEENDSEYQESQDDSSLSSGLRSNQGDPIGSSSKKELEIGLTHGTDTVHERNTHK